MVDIDYIARYGTVLWKILKRKYGSRIFLCRRAADRRNHPHGKSTVTGSFVAQDVIFFGDFQRYGSVLIFLDPDPIFKNNSGVGIGPGA